MMIHTRHRISSSSSSSKKGRRSRIAMLMPCNNEAEADKTGNRPSSFSFRLLKKWRFSPPPPSFPFAESQTRMGIVPIKERKILITTLLLLPSATGAIEFLYTVYTNSYLNKVRETNKLFFSLSRRTGRLGPTYYCKQPPLLLDLDLTWRSPPRLTNRTHKYSCHFLPINNTRTTTTNYHRN